MRKNRQDKKAAPALPDGFWPGLMPPATAKRAKAVAKLFRAGRIDEARKLAKEKS
ncbi:MAG: hypothetical protein ACYCSN_12390 [Acidobacteriaceae bacterium]